MIVKANLDSSPIINGYDAKVGLHIVAEGSEHWDVGDIVIKTPSGELYCFARGFIKGSSETLQRETLLRRLKTHESVTLSNEF